MAIYEACVCGHSPGFHSYANLACSQCDCKRPREPETGDLPRLEPVLSLRGCVFEFRRASVEYILAEAEYRQMVPVDGSGLTASLTRIWKAQDRLGELGRELDRTKRELLKRACEEFPE